MENNNSQNIINSFSSFYHQRVMSLQDAFENLVIDYMSFTPKHIIKTQESLLNEWCKEYQTVLSKYKNSFHIEEFQQWTEELRKDREKSVKDGHNFNMFEIVKYCGLSFGEVNHSKLLKFLMTSNSIHGQGYNFLHLFLEQLGILYPKKGHWQVTAEKGRIDILLYRSAPLSVIIIENKSNWAYDQPNQLYRYWHKFIYNTLNPQA